MTSARKSHMNVRANVSTDVATNHSEIVDTKYTSGTVVNFVSVIPFLNLLLPGLCRLFSLQRTEEGTLSVQYC